MAIIFLLALLAGFQTPLNTAEADWIASVSAKINGPTADQVWPYVADFCNVYKIFPSDVSFCVSGTEGQPGLTRYIVEKYVSPSNPYKDIIVKWGSEELVEIDAEERTETHTVRANNKGFTKFIATVQILPDENGSIFKWSIVAAPIPGITYNDFVSKLEDTASGVASLIQSLF